MTLSRRIACTACRQNKSRCVKGDDGQCRRCLSHGLVCREDPQFQRNNKKRKIEELEKRLEECLHAMGGQRNDSNPPTVVSSGSGPIAQQGFNQLPETDLEPSMYSHTLHTTSTYVPRRSLQDFAPGIGQPPSQVSIQISDESISVDSRRRLGSLELDVVQVQALFDIFFTLYHPFLPFLPQQSPNDCFTKSPLLFWTIISVASRRYEQDITLLRTLSAPVTKLAWDTISSNRGQLSTIQALLILCMWPFPSPSVFTENTAMWSDIAMNMAVQRGLHRPELPSDFTRMNTSTTIALRQEIVKTWAACLVISKGVAAVNGAIPAASFDFFLSPTSEAEYLKGLPVTLQHQLALQRFCCKATQNIFQGPRGLYSSQPTDVHSLIDPLHTELEHLLKDFGDLSNLSELYTISANLFLQVHHFFASETTGHKKLGILRAYSVAESFISTMSTANQNFNLYSYIPSYLLRMLFTAACVIWKVLNSSYRQDVSFDRGKALFNKALSALRKCSVENNDISARHAEILAQLWHGTTQNSEHRWWSPSLECTSRLSASLAYDCLFYWRDNIGGQKRIGLHSAATVPINSDPAEEPTSKDQHHIPDVFPESLEDQFNIDWDVVHWPSNLVSPGSDFQI